MTNMSDTRTVTERWEFVLDVPFHTDEARKAHPEASPKNTWRLIERIVIERVTAHLGSVRVTARAEGRAATKTGRRRGSDRWTVYGDDADRLARQALRTLQERGELPDPVEVSTW